MFSLFPKNTDFAPKFAESVQNITLISENFTKITKNWKNISKLNAVSREIEDAGDAIIKDIIISLNESFITPYDREDMYALASALDDIADQINHTANHLELYKIEKSKPHIEQFAELYTDSAAVLEKIIRHLFDKKVDQNEIEQLVILMGMLSAKWNAYYEESIRSLYEHEKDAIEVVKWDNIFKDLKYIMDAYKKSARIVEGIVMKVG